ncbi:uncharacterized protein LOC124896258 [Capsicum annuum]|uniref:uncharacterized protein LOC124896258 n=1 Tax=Capsicum annuum TaxID=4072 RepID=UPI001FB06847|nr:uncharacterized protein LOC124896258 [Capsicum annuum]
MGSLSTSRQQLVLEEAKLNGLKSPMIDWYQGDRYTLTPNGAYSISKSYQALLGPIPRLHEADMIWNSVRLPRQRFVTWLACKGRPLTKERMMKLHVPVHDMRCCLCDDNALETPKHLFMKCSWISGVSHLLSTCLGVQIQKKEASDNFKWIKRRRWKQFQKKIVAAVCGALVYHTWQARNRKIFRKTNVNIEFVSLQIQKELFEAPFLEGGRER